MNFVPKAAIRSMNREKGRKGGIATAQKHSKEWLQQRAQRAGQNTRDLYGADYYRHINSQRRVRRGWPKGKSRKVVQVQQHLNKLNLSAKNIEILNHIAEAFE